MSPQNGIVAGGTAATAPEWGESRGESRGTRRGAGDGGGGQFNQFHGVEGAGECGQR